MLEDMIKKAKKTYKISEEPVIDWSKTTNEKEKPIAEVLFTWDEMPGLTKKGDLTNLTYLFQTDFNVASTQLREILEDTGKSLSEALLFCQGSTEGRFFKLGRTY